MAGKKPMGRLLEVETGIVHYESAPRMDAVTLCQISDWLGTQGARDMEPDCPVTCQSCRWIFEYCNRFRA